MSTEGIGDCTGRWGLEVGSEAPGASVGGDRGQRASHGAPCWRRSWWDWAHRHDLQPRFIPLTLGARCWLDSAVAPEAESVGENRGGWASGRRRLAAFPAPQHGVGLVDGPEGKEGEVGG